MSNKETIRNLFNVINGCLPYEYDVELLNSPGRTASVLITKKDSGYVVQVDASEHDDMLTVTTYDDEGDFDKDNEICQWDTDSPDFTLDNVLTDIKNRF